ncbi:MAG: hypothetical protein ACP6IP_01195 [Candidatus Njordarchaeia archaeon]
MEKNTEIYLKIPEKLDEFITKLVEEGKFESKEDFVLHAIYMLSEFYGYTGEPILTKILSNLKLPLARGPAPGGLTEEEQFLIDAMGKSRFVYEDEFYALILKEAMIRKTTPLTREKFKDALESLIKKGILERVQHGNDVLIRKKEEL